MFYLNQGFFLLFVFKQVSSLLGKNPVESTPTVDILASLLMHSCCIYVGNDRYYGVTH